MIFYIKFIFFIDYYQLKMSKAKTSTFILENINVNSLEKKHILNDDMLMSSLRSSPKTKKTKIKDIFNSVQDKDFSLKEKKDYIKETKEILFYVSMNGQMLSQRDLEDKPIRCFNCHKNLNCVPLTVPIKFHPSLIKMSYIKPTKFFEDGEEMNTISYSQLCVSKKDREHPNCEKKDFFEGIGAVCSFECALGHAKLRLASGDIRFKDSYVLLNKMYFMMFKKCMPKLIEKHPFAYELTPEYGGICEIIPENLSQCVNTDSSTLNMKDTPTFKISSSIYQKLKK